MTSPVENTAAKSSAQKPQAVPVHTGSLYEKRRKIQVRDVSGRFNKWRWSMFILTQVLFYGLCWVDWNDRQAVLFHLVERKFYIFGMVLWPQDVIYLAVLLVLSAYALFLVTAIGGRLFCGYACPQTVYTEIYMWIERHIEGDRAARLKLDAQPMSLRKLRLRASKHLVWLLLALWTSFTFVGYFTPIKELAASLTTLSLGPWEWFWLFFYAGFLYMQAGFMREQVCKHMCPYARFQGVMFDPDTLIIGYDPERGEPRGPRRKNAELATKKTGDCIDCGLCVQVCPTGIDIRNGLQYECIACAKCIDVCDEVMDKVGSPRGLIRYSTENAMAQHYGLREILAHLMRPRTLLYGVILTAIVAGAAWSLAMRTPLKVDVLRDRGSLSREADDGRIENVFTLQIMNTDEDAHRFAISVDGIDGIDIVDERIVEVAGASARTLPLTVRVEAPPGKKGAQTIHFEVRALNHEDIAVREKASFYLP